MFISIPNWRTTALMLSISAILLSTACSDANRVYEEYQELPRYKWNYEHILPFEAEIEDTIQRYNICINLRHTNSYAYSNLWILLKTIYPSGKILEGRVNLPLANKAGKWNGHGNGDIINVEIPIQQNAILPEKGTYRFEMSQNMRINPLPNIMDIGIRIEKTEK